MNLPNDPDDPQSRMKGLVAGERGRGFLEIAPLPQGPIAKLKAIVERKLPRRGE